jgi:hypothetical protein
MAAKKVCALISFPISPFLDRKVFPYKIAETKSLTPDFLVRSQSFKKETDGELLDAKNYAREEWWFLRKRTKSHCPHWQSKRSAQWQRIISRKRMRES